MSNPAPIAIFAFNRPDRLARLLDSLDGCAGFAESTVTVFVDGPRHPADAEKIAEVRDLLAPRAGPRFEIVAATVNLGLKASIIAGVTLLCERHGRVIVIEDDLEFAPDALRYFNAALDAYADAPDVWSVCADMPDVPEFAGRRDCVFLPAGNSWGWATWARAWRRFDPAFRPPVGWFASRAFRQRMSIHGLRDYPTMLRLAAAGRIDSWFVLWQLAIVRHGGLAVYPPRPLVRNLGFNTGTHAGRFNLFSVFAGRKQLGTFDFTLRAEPSLDFEALDAVAASREWRLLRANSVLGRIKRTLLGMRHPQPAPPIRTTNP